jgi:hypothetical protein
MGIRMIIRHDDRDLSHRELLKIQLWMDRVLSSAVLECAACGKSLEPPTIDLYDHGHGWAIGLDRDQWVSLHCDACGYDTSLNKLKGKDPQPMPGAPEFFEYQGFVIEKNGDLFILRFEDIPDQKFKSMETAKEFIDVNYCDRSGESNLTKQPDPYDDGDYRY